MPTDRNWHHRLGMEVNDIGRKAQQHLRRGLSADAPTAIVVLFEELGMEIGPVFSDRVSHKHHLGEITALEDALIVGPETVETEPILL